MLAEAYQAKVQSGDVTRDPAQEAAVKHFDAFLTRWQKPKKAGFFSKISKKNPKNVKGVYLYGGVGRGKTMLMDLLVAHLHNPRVRRVHFHAFMLEIHARLKTIRDAAQTTDFLGTVANDIAHEVDLLCFDELHVNDIADAMILGPLFHELMKRGVSVIATSNYAPDDLYKNGLQRARFLPFIDILKANMDVTYLKSDTDYRLRALSEHGAWFHPLTDNTWSSMNALFEKLTGHVASATHLEIDGRSLPIVQADQRCAWLTFDVLCRENRGASDYLALGNVFEAVFVDGVPRLEEGNRDAARRFMTLVDTLYDLGRVLVIRAATTPDLIYQGDSHGFEFQRTISRLLEMQSPEWFAKANI